MPVGTFPLRRLGQDGPEVPAVGLGLMSMGGAYGVPPTDKQRFEVLDRAVELGATLWDCSDHYADVEEVIGKWFQGTGKREQVFFATRCGVVKENGMIKGIDSSGEYCKRACDASLKRLQTDYIDLYYIGRLNPDTPIEDTMRGLAQLRSEGKIKNIGLSGVSATALRRAHKIARVAAVQVEYSPFVLDIEGAAGTNLLKACRELGVAIVCYSPLGRGLLTGAFTTRESVSGSGDSRAAYQPRFSEENLEANVQLVNHFNTFAERKGCAPSQLALAWLLKQGNDTIPIPGTKKIKNLEENWDSQRVQLSEDEEAEIRRFLESAEVRGARSLPTSLISEYVDSREEA